MPEKQALYAADAYFWEGWEDLVDVAQASALMILQTHSFILVRPDAIASRKIEPVLQWLRLNSYSIVAATVLRPDRHQVRALWQYQWNAALPERKAACDILMGACPSLLLVIRPAPDGEETAAGRFARQKGAADPKASRTGDLRASLGHKSIMLSLIHSPDEPADLIREIAVLLPEAARKALLRRMMDGATCADLEVSRLAQPLYERTPEHALELEPSLARVEVAARRCMHSQAQAASDAVRLIQDIRNQVATDWRDLFDLLDACGAPWDEWDRITIAGHVIAMNHGNVRLLIPRAPTEKVAPCVGLQQTTAA